MPDHTHMIFTPNNGETLSRIMNGVKDHPHISSMRRSGEKAINGSTNRSIASFALVRT